MNVNMMAHFIIIFELKLGYRKRCLFRKIKNFALFTVNEKKDKEKLVLNFGIWMQMSSCYLRQCEIVSYSM